MFIPADVIKQNGSAYAGPTGFPQNNWPNQPMGISNLVAWYRADMGITTISGKVSAWNDSSTTGDANQNLAQATAGNRPTFIASDAAYNNRPTINFVAASSTNLLSGTWASPIAQPYTTIIVGSDDGSATSQGFIDTQSASEAAILASAGSGTYQFYSGSFLDSTVITSSTPKVFIGTWTGSNATIYISAKTAKATGAVGSNPYNALTVGSIEGGADPLNGKIAEVLIYSRVLSTAEINKILTYCGARYAITIGN